MLCIHSSAVNVLGIVSIRRGEGERRCRGTRLPLSSSTGPEVPLHSPGCHSPPILARSPSLIRPHDPFTTSRPSGSLSLHLQRFFFLLLLLHLFHLPYRPISLPLFFLSSSSQHQSTSLASFLLASSLSLFHSLLFLHPLFWHDVLTFSIFLVNSFFLLH